MDPNTDICRRILENARDLTDARAKKEVGVAKICDSGSSGFLLPVAQLFRGISRRLLKGGEISDIDIPATARAMPGYADGVMRRATIRN